MKGITRFGLAWLMLMACSGAVADNDFGVGVKAGTLGAGIEGTWRPVPYLDVRVGTNFFDYDDTGTQAGVNYDATLSLDTVYAHANFHFPLSPMRITAGLHSNGNELLLESAESGSFDVGGTTYTGAEIGTLRSNSTFGSTSPYLGFGFDFSVMDKVGLALDLGVLWQGDPNVAVTADGLLASDPTFLQSLEEERLELEDEVSDFKAWPVISLGFVYNF